MENPWWDSLPKWKQFYYWVADWKIFWWGFGIVARNVDYYKRKKKDRRERHGSR